MNVMLHLTVILLFLLSKGNLSNRVTSYMLCPLSHLRGRKFFYFLFPSLHATRVSLCALLCLLFCVSVSYSIDLCVCVFACHFFGPAVKMVFFELRITRAKCKIRLNALSFELNLYSLCTFGQCKIYKCVSFSLSLSLSPFLFISLFALPLFTRSNHYNLHFHFIRLQLSNLFSEDASILTQKAREETFVAFVLLLHW